MAEDDARVPRRWELRTISLGPKRTASSAPVHGRFDEIAELGRGGMGRVVEAIDRTLGRTVAIKHSLAADAVSLARFQREVLITARLSHPSIMPILDVGRDDAGQPLAARASSDGRTVAALVVIGGVHRVAIWTDPVPVLPALLPAYLAGLTGARLGRDSDAVTWAP